LVGTPSFTDISNAAGYKDYTLGALSTNDFYVSATGSNGLKLNSLVLMQLLLQVAMHNTRKNKNV
jgi:hypothetical protein